MQAQRVCLQGNQVQLCSAVCMFCFSCEGGHRRQSLTRQIDFSLGVPYCPLRDTPPSHIIDPLSLSFCSVLKQRRDVQGNGSKQVQRGRDAYIKIKIKIKWRERETHVTKDGEQNEGKRQGRNGSCKEGRGDAKESRATGKNGMAS